MGRARYPAFQTVPVVAADGRADSSGDGNAQSQLTGPQPPTVLSPPPPPHNKFLGGLGGGGKGRRAEREV